jgi:hypothetical protein
MSLEKSSYSIRNRTRDLSGLVRCLDQMRHRVPHLHTVCRYRIDTAGYDGLCSSSGVVSPFFPTCQQYLDIRQFRAPGIPTANRTRTALQNLLSYIVSSGRNCVVCTGTRYALEVTGFELRCGETFRAQPDLPRGPPSLCTMASGFVFWR